MSLQRLSIHGFGHFYNRDIVLAAGLNLISGPNEAGKTTLVRFIRYVLFARRRRVKDRALADGTLGGSILLDTPEGPLLLEHTPNRTHTTLHGRPVGASVRDAAL